MFAEMLLHDYAIIVLRDTTLLRVTFSDDDAALYDEPTREKMPRELRDGERVDERMTGRTDMVVQQVERIIDTIRLSHADVDTSHFHDVTSSTRHEFYRLLIR